MPSGLYLGTKQFANVFLGSQSVEEIYLGPDLVWSRTTVLPIGSDTMFLGNMAAVYSGREMLALDLNITPANNIGFYRELAGNVYASSSVDYGIPAAAFASSADLTSYIDGGRCKAISASAFQNASTLITASFTSASVIEILAFGYCSNLSSIDFPNAVTASDSSFRQTSIVNATFPKAELIGSGSFLGCTSLVTASFPLVTNIAPFAFANCRSLVSASFPNATTIGGGGGFSAGAFYSCSLLVSASFPNVTTIGQNAFRSCTNLKVLPTASVTLIGTGSFRLCPSITEAIFPLTTTIGQQAFYACTALATASFASATTVGPNAFEACLSLTSINFPNATTLGQYAFRYSGLVTASFPNVVTIGYAALGDCFNLVSASFPSAQTLGDAAFYNNFSLQNISLPALTDPNALTGTLRFSGIGYTGSITVPAYYLAINGGNPATALQSLHSYPDFGYGYNILYQNAPYWNINYLTGSSIFVGDNTNTMTQSELEDKLVGETLSGFGEVGAGVIVSSSTNYYISESAFANSASITSYVDQGKCTSISGSAFYTCTYLETASFANVTKLTGNDTFANSLFLTNVTFPVLSSISGSSTFYNCVSIPYLDLPALTYAGPYTFANCTSLKNIAVPNLTYLGEYGFFNSYQLGTNQKPIRFPKLKTVGPYAFSYCSNLTSLYLMGLSGSNALGGSTGNTGVFDNIAAYGTIYVPNFYSQSNAGNPDGDLAYLAGRGWYIAYS